MKQFLIIVMLAFVGFAFTPKVSLADYKAISPKIEKTYNVFDKSVNCNLAVNDFDLELITARIGEEITPIHPKPESVKETIKGHKRLNELPPLIHRYRYS